MAGQAGPDVAEADAVLVGVTTHPASLGPLRRLRVLAPAAALVAVHHDAGSEDRLDLVITGAQDFIGLDDASSVRLDRAIRAAIVRKANEDAALSHALTDPVTGMPARAWMLQRLELAVDHATSGTDGWEVAVLFCDLDRFKAVNDSLGHACGDEVLRLVAERLRSVVRAEDPLVRFGGDEFVILLEGLGIESLANRVALRALAALAQPFEVDGHTVSVLASIGLSLLATGESAQDLLDHADLALYRAKRRGRNRVETFDAELRAWSDHQHDLAATLRDDLRAGRLELARTPLWDLAESATVGTLAVPSWPRVGSASELVELAVRNGLGPELGRWIIRSAIAAGADAPAGSQIVVEIPAGLIVQPAFVTWIDEVLATSGIDPSRLVVAIGEDELGDDDVLGGVLDALDRLGVSIALSDFGTRKASLTLFSSLTVDEVFLAADLVAGIASDPTRRAVVDGLLRIARAIGQRVVATGPESIDDVAVLVELGCEAVVTDLGLVELPSGPLVDLGSLAGPNLVTVR